MNNQNNTNNTTSTTFKDLIKTTASPSKVVRESFRDESFLKALEAHAVVLQYQSRARSIGSVLAGYEVAKQNNDPVRFLTVLSDLMDTEVDSGTKVFSFACRAMARKAK